MSSESDMLEIPLCLETRSAGQYQVHEDQMGFFFAEDVLQVVEKFGYDRG